MDCRRRRPRRRARRATRRRSAPRSSAARSPASTRSRSSAARACASGASRRRHGCRRAHAYHDARETFAKLGVGVSEPQLDFAQAAAWKDGVVDADDRRRRRPLQGQRRRVGQRQGTFTSPNTIAVEGAEDVTFKSAIVATGSYPMRPPIPGLDSPRCVDSTGLLSQTEVPAPARRPRRRHHRLRVRLDLQPLRQRGDDRRDAAAPDPAGGRGRGEGARRRRSKRRGITQHLEKQCTGVDDHGSHLTVHFGDGETVDADLMLVSVGRAPLVDGLGLDAIGVTTDRKGHRARTTTCAPPSRTSTRPATSPGAGSSRTPASARARSPPRTRWATSRARRARPCRGRSTPTPRSPASGSPRRRRASCTATPSPSGALPWVANARAVMSGDTTGWVKSIHESTYGELLGIVIVGPHATDLIGGRRRARRRVDGRDGRRRHRPAPHPRRGDQGGRCSSRSGRAIHLPPRRR